MDFLGRDKKISGNTVLEDVEKLKKLYNPKEPASFGGVKRLSDTLNGEWECCLSEVTLPGNYFTIQPRSNDFYTVTREIEVPDETLLSTFDISLYNEDHEDFVAGFNANMKNIFTDPPLVFTLTNNKRQLKMELKRGFDWIITPEEGNQLLRVLGLDPNKNLKIRHKPEGFTVVRRYQAPNRDMFKNQTIRLIAKEPVLDETFEIKLEGDLIEQIDSKINELGLTNELQFSDSNGQILVKLPFSIKIEFKKTSCPRPGLANLFGSTDFSKKS
ncbi:uncharacterized protein TNCV_1198671 [Trichonephila clavipes]|uniref:Uncharacterized protein n=1 Tax=Trichonephila clavipes TaxID=2585209 RepID=A0A8X6VE44_TRICX|nr:uncharacterized protein TNCV_1198671 [Trichonephila clavipes]